MSKEGDALSKARLLLDELIFDHHAASIPAMIAACVGWAIEHGAPQLVRDSMQHAIEMSHEAEKVWKREAN